ncbi:MAG: CBS domain-containing protein [Methylococcales bacterium]
MLKSVNSRDFMTENPVTFPPDTNIFTVIHELIVHKVSGATVIDEENHLLGVISQGDCLKAILDGTYHGYANGTVEEVMTTKVDTIDPGLDLIDAARILLTTKRGRLPVVEDGKFIGQISIRSILRAVKEFDVPPDPTER